MICRGTYRRGEQQYDLIIKQGRDLEVVLLSDGEIASAYKKDANGIYFYRSKKAKEAWDLINSGLKWCTAKKRIRITF